jgi:hypothetical protein
VRTDGTPSRLRQAAGNKEVVGMPVLYTVIVFVFVIGVLAAAGFALFEITPFARHKDRYRDSSGKRIESPRLD